MSILSIYGQLIVAPRSMMGSTYKIHEMSDFRLSGVELCLLLRERNRYIVKCGFINVKSIMCKYDRIELKETSKASTSAISFNSMLYNFI